MHQQRRRRRPDEHRQLHRGEHARPARDGRLRRSSGTWVAFKAARRLRGEPSDEPHQGGSEILVAYELDGGRCPTSHGFSGAHARYPGHYGMKGPKWLDSISVVDHESGGYWEQQGWDHNAVVKTTSRFDVPARRRHRQARPDAAWPAWPSRAPAASARSSTAPTAGATWTAATLEPPLSPSHLGALEGDVDAGRRRRLHAAGRATDETGAVQASGNCGELPERRQRLPHDSGRRREVSDTTARDSARLAPTGPLLGGFIARLDTNVRNGHASFHRPEGFDRVPAHPEHPLLADHLQDVRLLLPLRCPSTRKNSSSALSATCGYLVSICGLCSSSGTALSYFFMSAMIHEWSSLPLYSASRRSEKSPASLAWMTVSPASLP